MKYCLLLFFLSFFTYWIVATRGTFVISQDLDYFNAQAQAFLHGRLDIENPIFTEELSLYKGKWYMYYGPLPALPLAVAQFFTGRIFIPTIYLNIFFSAVNVVLVFLIVERVRKNLFVSTSRLLSVIFSLLFAFGTVQFWLAVRSGFWFLAQTTSFFFSSFGLFFILKKKPTKMDYFFSCLFISLNFFGRVQAVLLLFIPLTFIFLHNKKIFSMEIAKTLLAVTMPGLIILLLFMYYNFVRFQSPFETGFRYQKFHSHYLARYQNSNGWFNLKNIPENLWFMVFETPLLTLTKMSVALKHNPEGNSIFYLTPPFVAIFLTRIWKRTGKKIVVDPLVVSLWIGLILTLLPILMLSGTGWQQFGYRYTLDITVPLILLTLLAVRMRLNLLFVMAIFFAVFVQTLGALYA